MALNTVTAAQRDAAGAKVAVQMLALGFVQGESGEWMTPAQVLNARELARRAAAAKLPDVVLTPTVDPKKEPPYQPPTISPSVVLNPSAPSASGVSAGGEDLPVGEPLQPDIEDGELLAILRLPTLPVSPIEDEWFSSPSALSTPLLIADDASITRTNARSSGERAEDARSQPRKAKGQKGGRKKVKARKKTTGKKSVAPKAGFKPKAKAPAEKKRRKKTVPRWEKPA